MDDDKSSLTLYSIICQRAGIEAITIQSPLILMDQLEEFTAFDLIILNFHMPGLNGFQVFTLLKAIPAYEPVPIVLCSTQDILKEEAKTLGFSGFILKPFQIERFQRQIDDLLMGKDLWDE